MGRKKKSRKFTFPAIAFPHISLELPEGAQRSIWAILFFTVALILLFSFFDKAGIAGHAIYAGADYAMGRGAVLLPLMFVLAGVVLLRMKTSRKKAVLFATVLFLLGVSGILGSFEMQKGGEAVREIAGWMGFVLVWPMSQLFGFWVSEVIFSALAVISLIIFWQLLPHEEKATSRDETETDLRHTAQEKIKKFFEPKFEVREVEPDIGASQETAQEEEKQKRQEKQSKKEEQPALEPLSYLSSEDYTLPPLDLLEAEKGLPNAGDVKLYASAIKKTLQNFGIEVEMAEVSIGPAVTQYTFKPAEGVKLARITTLRNDLALALAAHPIRIEAPIPGKSLVGVELPNKARAMVRLRSLLEHDQFQTDPAPLLLALGKDVSGAPIYADLAKMPHLLVAGATGSGKTIGLNNIVLSLMYRNSPDRLRFILVDPKRVEFPVYNELPHMLTPVVVENQKAVNVLKWLLKEMDRRFIMLSNVKERDIKGYHARLSQLRQQGKGEDWEPFPYIVAVIDELADLMASRGKEIEGMIVRLAQMARAVGIHLVLATQRPSVEVLTGLIKANITSRMAFQVASQVDSRTILDSAGAEQLLGQGDMLFVSSDFSKPRRVQGAYVSDKEVKKIINWIAEENQGLERDEIGEDELGQQGSQRGLELFDSGDGGEDDPLYEEAKRIVVSSRKASSSLLQRRLKVGYARAARLIDLLEERGVIGSAEGAKPREVYVQSADGEDGESGQESDDNDSRWYSPRLGE